MTTTFLKSSKGTLIAQSNRVDLNNQPTPTEPTMDYTKLNELLKQQSKAQLELHELERTVAKLDDAYSLLRGSMSIRTDTFDLASDALYEHRKEVSAQADKARNKLFEAQYALHNIANPK